MATLLQSSLPGCLIPAYVPLTGNENWWAWIIQIKQTYPLTPMAVIINISNTPGGAGSTTNAAWNTQINALRTAGIIVLGYIDVVQSTELQSVTESRIDSWKTLYPQIDGIFFDNLGIASTDQTYNTAIANYAKVTKGFATVGANCKVAATMVETTWHSQTVPIDTFVVFDNAGLDTVDTSYSKFQAAGVNKNQLSVFCHTAPIIDTSWLSQMSAYVGWIYTTSNTNYNSFPTYLGSLVQQLQNIRTGSNQGTATDKWGINKIYHDIPGGTQHFMNRDDIFNDPDVDNIASENMTKTSAGHWTSDGGSNGWLRAELWTPQLTPDAARLAARFNAVEVTVYARVLSQTGGPPYAWQLYSRGGHHGNPTNCEGSALKARFVRDANEITFVKEICHACYTGNRGTMPGKLATGRAFGDGRWYGTKLVIYNIVENGVTYTKQEIYVDPVAQDASGNLVIGNNWQFCGSYIDRGDWFCDSGRYSSDCDGCTYARNEILILPGGRFTSGEKRFHCNLVAYRTDEEKTEFDYFSGREIDPTKPVATTPTPGGGAPAPPDPPGTTGGGGGDPGGGGTGGGGSTPPPDPQTQTGVDKWGIKKIFPTANGGDEFYLNMADVSSNLARFNPKAKSSTSLTKNADGTWKFKQSAGVSMQVYQINGYDPVVTANAASDQATAHGRGFLQNENDFTNVECTIYCKINTTEMTDDFFWLVRGGEHERNAPNCEGACLRLHIGSDGSTEMRKEQWHVQTVGSTRGNVLGTTLMNKWVGIKCVVLNKFINGVLLTSQQLWVDINNTNSWQLVDQRTDAGGWGNAGGICRGAADQLVSWGSPMVQFGWTSFSDVDFKFLSVREIDPAAIPIDAPPPDPVGSCAGA